MLLFFLSITEKKNKEYQAFQEGILKLNHYDMGWLECDLAIADRKKICYRSWKDQSEDLSCSTYAMANAVTLLVLGDWGMGLRQASDLMKKAITFHPDFLLHLRDTYYSGNQQEQEAYFLYPLRNISRLYPFLALAGNHDMQSGGEAYYWILDQIGQQTSFF